MNKSCLNCGRDLMTDICTLECSRNIGATTNVDYWIEIKVCPECGGFCHPICGFCNGIGEDPYRECTCKECGGSGYSKEWCKTCNGLGRIL